MFYEYLLEGGLRLGAENDLADDAVGGGGGREGEGEEGSGLHCCCCCCC